MSMTNKMATEQHPQQHQSEIDEGLYSRQLYVLGHDGMRKLCLCDVLVSGMRGLGVEIAKNLVLAGPRSVTIHDTGSATWNDLSSQFYLRPEDLGANRADATKDELQQLNSYVYVNAYAQQLSEEYLQKFHAVVLTDSSLEEQRSVGEFCHRQGIHFIIADTRGLFGQIFCDFGEKFTVIDATGEPPLQYLVASISRDQQGLVTCAPDVRHLLDEGDEVTFSQVKGMTQLNGLTSHPVTAVHGKYSFSIDDTSSFDEYKSGGVVTYVKQPTTVNFKSVKDALNSPQFVNCDSEKNQRQMQLHVAFQALHEYSRRHGAVPRPRCTTDVDRFVEITEQLWRQFDRDADTLDITLIRQFGSCAAGQICPMQAVIGGITAQEVLKACTGKFMPLQQWFYFDSLECLPPEDTASDELTEENCAPRGCRYDGQIAVFGEKFQQRLSNARLFLVGAGAIGCEMLKNWALMGIAAGRDGKITVTDMDRIEKSNLNRQFLFRPSDIDRPKSATAAVAVKQMNPAVRVEAHENRLCEETEEVYSEDFFSTLTAVVNALDNVAARVYVDKRCVYFKRPLLESGTNGMDCHFQPIIPDLTESYNSRPMPSEKQIPVCTLKYFPTTIHHTIQWSRNQFEEFFSQQVQVASNYLSDPQSCLNHIRNLRGYEKLEKLKALESLLVNEGPKTFEDCVRWARRTWQSHFYDQIRQILHSLPPDHTTSQGLPFWSGPKRCPHPLLFDPDNSLHVDYIMAAANLQAFVFGLKQTADRADVANMAAKITVSEFVPSTDEQIAKTEDEFEQNRQNVTVDEELVERIVKKLPDPATFGQTLNLVEFEKDDDSNFHMDFIVAASNLRAENYDISPADQHQTKLVAGRIIPAIATITSMIVGFVCLELYKLIQGHKELKFYKSGFLKLAIPFFGLSQPSPAKPDKKYLDKEFTLWDRFEFSGDVTIGQFIDYFKRQHQLNVESILYGKCSLFMPCLLTEQEQAERLALTVSDAVQLVTGQPLPAHLKSFQLEINCVDDSGSELEVPFVKYNFRSS